MTLCTLYLRFDLPEVHSLKGRRSLLNSLKERLKLFNVSLLDISGDYPKEAEIALAFLSHDDASAAHYKEAILQMLESRFPHLECEIDEECF